MKHTALILSLGSSRRRLTRQRALSLKPWSDWLVIAADYDNLRAIVSSIHSRRNTRRSIAIITSDIVFGSETILSIRCAFRSVATWV